MVTVFIWAGEITNGMECRSVLVIQNNLPSQVGIKLCQISLKCEFATELTVTFLIPLGFNFVQCALQESYSVICIKLVQL